MRCGDCCLYSLICYGVAAAVVAVVVSVCR